MYRWMASPDSSAGHLRREQSVDARGSSGLGGGLNRGDHARPRRGARRSTEGFGPVPIMVNCSGAGDRGSLLIARRTPSIGGWIHLLALIRLGSTSPCGPRHRWLRWAPRREPHQPGTVQFGEAPSDCLRHLKGDRVDMFVVAKVQEAPQSLRTAQLLSSVILVLTAVAAAGGIFMPGLYRGNAWVVTATRAQDWFTLVAVLPALVVTLWVTRRGTIRPRVVLFGLLGYVFYTYTGAAFAFALNEFYLIHLARFTLSGFAIGSVLSSIHIGQLTEAFDAATPRKSVSIFLVVVGLMLALGELGQIIPFITSGKIPLPLELSGGSNFFVWTMDIGMVAPLSVLAACWLWRRVAWGYALAGFMLIKCATMGLMLLTSTFYAWSIGVPHDGIDLITGYAIIALGGLGMSTWFFRHCRG